MNIMEQDFIEAIDRGVDLLDSIRPDWYKRVNLDDFDMSSADRCVAGWVFKDMVADMIAESAQDGEYPPNEDLTGFDYLENLLCESGYGHGSSYFGFDGSIESGYEEKLREQYPLLAELWLERIEKKMVEEGSMMDWPNGD